MDNRGVTMDGTATATGALNGTLEERDGRFLLRFERRLPHPPEAVWQALTEPNLLAAWFPQDVTYDGERGVGGWLWFSWREGDDPPFGGEILAYDPPRLFEYTWEDETLRFELRPDGDDGTLLVFTDAMDDRDRAARNAAGWHACLDALATLLAGQSPASPKEHAADIRGGYAARFA